MLEEVDGRSVAHPLTSVAGEWLPPSVPPSSRCSGLSSFEGGRTDLAERRVTASLVVEHFDVVEQCHLGFAAALEMLAELELHRGEETLHHRVVIAVAATADAAGDAVGRQPALVVLAGVGAALIRVVQQPTAGHRV